MATPRTYFLHLSLTSVILTDSSRESPVHVLMLSTQAVHLALFLALSLSPLFPHGLTMRFVRPSVLWRSCLGCSHRRPVRDVRTADSSADGRRSAAIFATVELPSTGGGDTLFVVFLLVDLHWWLGSRVVSVLDSGAEGPGFKSQSRRCRVTVLGKLLTSIVHLFTKQQNW